MAPWRMAVGRAAPGRRAPAAPRAGRGAVPASAFVACRRVGLRLALRRFRLPTGGTVGGQSGRGPGAALTTVPLWSVLRETSLFVVKVIIIAARECCQRVKLEYLNLWLCAKIGPV